MPSRRIGRHQLALRFPKRRARGGKRRGAGRPPNGRLAGVWHVRRPGHDRRHPVHVTWRVREEVASLRTKKRLAALRAAMERGRERFGFRLVHYSVQGNHLHLVCEADDRTALRRGLQGLAIRLAKRLNRALGRRGKVFADRYHARALRTPREVRSVLAYVLGNHQKHSGGTRYSPRQVDPYSSALHFDGWSCRVRSVEGWRDLDRCTAEPASWLLRVGWQRAGGLLDPVELARVKRCAPGPKR
jgi:REP element-mobilizing transposase RayT